MANKYHNLVGAIEKMLSKYVILSEGLPFVLALYALATHIYDVFDAFPYIAITSPTKRCGKTRCAEVLALFVKEPIPATATSAAAMFRKIAESGPTLIVDEAESLSSGQYTEIRAVMNTGYRRGSVVLKVIQNEVAEFPTYCPKILILIGEPQDTISDRSIFCVMQRKTEANALPRFIQAFASQESAKLREQVYDFKREMRTVIEKEYHTMGDLGFVTDREAELWIPIFAVARVLVPERVQELKKIAIHLSALKEKDEPGDYGIRLLQDLRIVFDKLAAHSNGEPSKRGKRIYTKKSKQQHTSLELVEYLLSLEESAWADINLDQRKMAALLKPYNIESIQVKQGKGAEQQVVRGYRRESFEESWKRYAHKG